MRRLKLKDGRDKKKSPPTSSIPNESGNLESDDLDKTTDLESFDSDEDDDDDENDDEEQKPIQQSRTAASVPRAREITMPTVTPSTRPNRFQTPTRSNNTPNAEELLDEKNQASFAEVIEEFGTDIEGHEVHITRKEPSVYNGHKISGFLGKFQGGVGLDKDFIKQKYGGGQYLVQIKGPDRSGRIVFKKQFTTTISGKPRLEEDEEKKDKDNKSSDATLLAALLPALIASKDSEAARIAQLSQQQQNMLISLVTKNPVSESMVEMLKDQRKQLTDNPLIQAANSANEFAMKKLEAELKKIELETAARNKELEARAKLEKELREQERKEKELELKQAREEARLREEKEERRREAELKQAREEARLREEREEKRRAAEMQQMQIQMQGQMQMFSTMMQTSSQQAAQQTQQMQMMMQNQMNMMMGFMATQSENARIELAKGQDTTKLLMDVQQNAAAQTIKLLTDNNKKEDPLEKMGQMLQMMKLVKELNGGGEDKEDDSIMGTVKAMIPAIAPMAMGLFNKQPQPQPQQQYYPQQQQQQQHYEIPIGGAEVEEEEEEQDQQEDAQVEEYVPPEPKPNYHHKQQPKKQQNKPKKNNKDKDDVVVDVATTKSIAVVNNNVSNASDNTVPAPADKNQEAPADAPVNDYTDFQVPSPEMDSQDQISVLVKDIDLAVQRKIQPKQFMQLVRAFPKATLAQVTMFDPDAITKYLIDLGMSHWKIVSDDGKKFLNKLLPLVNAYVAE